MWQIKIHKLVVNKDLKKIPAHEAKLIIKTIYKKLSLSPEKYGEPLRHLLKGYRKLKISHYRVIYKVEKQQVIVLVLKVGIRRDAEVYKEMIPRLKKL